MIEILVPPSVLPLLGLTSRISVITSRQYTQVSIVLFVYGNYKLLHTCMCLKCVGLKLIVK